MVVGKSKKLCFCIAKRDDQSTGLLVQIMACAICKLNNRREINSFPTEAVFIGTARRIQELIDKNDMICLMRHFRNTPFDQR